jgi:hypothetical protein
MQREHQHNICRGTRPAERIKAEGPGITGALAPRDRPGTATGFSAAIPALVKYFRSSAAARSLLTITAILAEEVCNVR